jgi:hypothetical protein
MPAPPRLPGTNGRPPKHGGEFHLADPATWPQPDTTSSAGTSRYGTAVAHSWNRLHPRLTRRAAWLDHDGDLPVLEGTLIRLTVDHLPGDRDPKPLWLWYSSTNCTPSDVDRLWQAFLRRFDLEHTFRLFKQTLGWTIPKLRDPAAADRWTWLIITAHTQPRLARHLAADLRLPWKRPTTAERLTPARVRRGFRNLHAKTSHPASAPKPTTPGPGRLAGSTNRTPAIHDDVGKTTKSRCRWFQISVRSSSSRRQVWTHRSMIAFIRGTRTPLSTMLMPALASTGRTVSGICRPGRGSGTSRGSRRLPGP